ncbi:DMT family transporter [Martelella sp. HB161492]|uniref:DMT family transporter n=1 Tax=Martelella sp. HB161492 TaxID=2720726 RepID=UPI0015925785|nr:DMT family transporter [Martelella sp. HB161492]
MQIKAYSLLTITTLLWAGNLVAGKLAVGHVSPMMLNVSRWAIAAFAVTIFSLPQIRRDWPVIRANWLLLLAYGAVGFSAFNAFLYSALKHTGAINGAVDQAGIPLMIFLLNFALFRIRASLAQLFGFFLTFVGVIIAVTHGHPADLARFTINFGDALMVMAVLCYSLYTVSLRWKPQLDWRSMMMACCSGAFLAALPMVFMEAKSGDLQVPTDTVGILAVIYTGLLPSLVSQALFIRGVELIGPNRAGLFINLIPVFGILLAVFLLGEDLQPFHIVALILAITGIAIAEKGKPKET